MELSDQLAITSLVFSALSTLGVGYLAYAALVHTAKPRIMVKLVGGASYKCGSAEVLKFYFDNIGYWYAKPMAINVFVYINFQYEFRLIEIRYGSVQEIVNTQIRDGVGNMQYFEASGIMLAHGEPGEEVHVKLVMPEDAGGYALRVVAFSENGAWLKKDIEIICEH